MERNIVYVGAIALLVGLFLPQCVIKTVEDDEPISETDVGVDTTPVGPGPGGDTATLGPFDTATPGIDDTGTGPDGTIPPGPLTTVFPAVIDDVLYNPGMGFTDFHFSWGNVSNPPPYPSPSTYPPSTVAYFRWHWKDIEPIRGQFDFSVIDTVITNAANRSAGEQLAFRIMSADADKALPNWLLQGPYAVSGATVGGVFMPDYRDETFLSELERLVEAVAARYDGHPGVDHYDIGTVGCWGEWNTACLSGINNFCQLYGLGTGECGSVTEAFKEIVDIHVEAFETTKLVMLAGEAGAANDALVHAVKKGTGWRVDCFGDWGFWGAWSHMTDLYPTMMANATAAFPGFPDVWKTAPVQLEVCGTITSWSSQHGYSPEQVQASFDWALDHHASVVNAKSSPIPSAYWPVINDYLKKSGYRFVLESLTHTEKVMPGGVVVLDSDWKNAGVAPVYYPHVLAYRLRSGGGTILAQGQSDVDLRDWLPGVHGAIDEVIVPLDAPLGDYYLDVALLPPLAWGDEPMIHLGIEGRRPDGWYEISEVEVSTP